MLVKGVPGIKGITTSVLNYNKPCAYFIGYIQAEMKIQIGWDRIEMSENTGYLLNPGRLR